jgi:hypothetical protein
MTEETTAQLQEEGEPVVQAETPKPELIIKAAFSGPQNSNGNGGN